MSHPKKQKIAIVFAVLLIFGVTKAFACVCEPHSVKEATGYSSAVFSGKVIGIEYRKGIPLQMFPKGQSARDESGKIIEHETEVVKIRVQRWWKGDPASEVVLATNSIKYPNGTTGFGSCDYDFTQGETYLIYAELEDDWLRVTKCSRTRKLSGAEEDLKILGEGKVPIEKKEEPKDEVSIYPQPKSPIQLSNVVTSWRISKHPDGEETNLVTIHFLSQNLSDKAIRAYTFRFFEGVFNSNLGGTLFTYAPSVTNLFQPTQARNEGYGEFGSTRKRRDFKIAVDFVEFADGTTWGADMSDSAQYLSGTRAGIKAIQEHLLDIKQRTGLEAVIKVLDETVNLVQPENQNEKWKRGFQNGVRIKRNLIRSSYEKGGIKAVETELKTKPF